MRYHLGETVTVSTVEDFKTALSSTEPLTIVVNGNLDMASEYHTRIRDNKTIVGSLTRDRDKVGKFIWINTPYESYLDAKDRERSPALLWIPLSSTCSRTWAAVCIWKLRVPQLRTAPMSNTAWKNADCDLDGTLSSHDSVTVLKYLVHLITTPALCKQYNKTYRNPPKGMYRNSPISVQVLARKCTSKPIMI